MTVVARNRPVTVKRRSSLDKYVSPMGADCYVFRVLLLTLDEQ